MSVNICPRFRRRSRATFAARLLADRSWVFTDATRIAALPRLFYGESQSALQSLLESDWKAIAAMSEYPRSSLDKAALKFAPQDGKKSRNVSAGITLFFLFLFGNSCRSVRNRIFLAVF
ncbi:hypothetical protein [Paraburkholderia diazotrophica]|uniref:hypothetical protein n=1 Tax=Paraburkholderia diazotrophica TaxID=667676 RepID=UPI00115FC3E8|nr:hypothetical protein [Paraburkholderia diazotrophica]